MSLPAFVSSIEQVKPYIVQISTPSAVGTGFLFVQSHNRNIVGIATAAHVISNAYLWEQPIRLRHYESGKSIMLRVPERAILIEQNLDTAAIVFQRGEIPFPESEPKLSPEGKFLRIAYEIGWMGFPAVSPNNLCFFSGRISSMIHSERAYLVDGVVINGVSGGPAFWATDESDTFVIGVVSAYIPNRATGETLPGLAIIRDVGQFHSVIKEFRSIYEAKEEETELSPSAQPPDTNDEDKDESETRTRDKSESAAESDLKDD